MNNITVSVPDHVYRNAVIAAAQRDTSVEDGEGGGGKGDGVGRD
jgi:hypothetical protein